MEIKVLGSACTNCKRLEGLVQEVTLETGMNATVEKVTDLMEIMRYRILGLPGLVIDGNVVCAGRVPSKTELITWLTDATRAAPPAC